MVTAMKKRNASSYRITTINPIADERWDQFVENHPFGWICHHSGWKVVKDLNDFKERWGTLVSDMSHFHYPATEASGIDALREDAFSYRLMRKACKKAPVFALPHIGNFCYRHMGYNLSFQRCNFNKINETCPAQVDRCLEVLASAL
jgi:hypothetical protein